MLKKIIRRFKLLTALEASVTALIGFLLGAWISHYLHAGSPLIGGLWAMISAVIIGHVNYREMLNNAKNRVLGTLIGVLISWIVFSFMGYHDESFFIGMLLSVMICAFFKLSLYRLSCITVAIIFAVSQVGGIYISPWVNASSRFLESCVGVAIALVLSGLIYFIRKRFDLTEPA